MKAADASRLRCMRSTARARQAVRSAAIERAVAAAVSEAERERRLGWIETAIELCDRAPTGDEVEAASAVLAQAPDKPQRNLI